MRIIWEDYNPKIGSKLDYTPSWNYKDYNSKIGSKLDYILKNCHLNIYVITFKIDKAWKISNTKVVIDTLVWTLKEDDGICQFAFYEHCCSPLRGWSCRFPGCRRFLPSQQWSWSLSLEFWMIFSFFFIFCVSKS